MFGNGKVLGFRRYATSDDVVLAKVIDENESAITVKQVDSYSYQELKASTETLIVSDKIYQRLFLLPDAAIESMKQKILNCVKEYKPENLVKALDILDEFFPKKDLKEFKQMIKKDAEVKMDAINGIIAKTKAAIEEVEK